MKEKRHSFADFKSRKRCYFGVTETLVAGLVAAGIGETTAGILAPALIGAAVGGGSSALTGGNVLKGAGLGAVTGGIGGGVSAAGGLTGIGDSIGGAFGDATLGTDIGSGISSIGSGISDGLSNFSNTSGLSQLFGGTAAPTDSLTDSFNGINGAAPDAGVTAGASNAASSGGALSGYLPSGGSLSAAGGGAPGGGFDIGSVGESSALPSSTGIGSGLSSQYSDALAGDYPGTIESGFGTDNALTAPGASIGTAAPASANAGTFSFDGSGAASGASTGNVGQQFLNSSLSTGASPVANSGLSGLFGSNGSNQLVNGLLKSGLTGLLNNPNNKGFNAQINAGQQISNDYQPYLQSGTAANNTLSDLYGTNGAAAQTGAQQNWQNTPGYQFALSQGLNAVNADAAAKGQTLSGNNQQAIQQYGTGLANQTYNNYIQNLQQQAGQGVNAAGGVASGQAGVANAQAGKSGAGAQNQNTALGGIANALFPSGGISLAQLLGGQNGANSGLLSLFNS